MSKGPRIGFKPAFLLLFVVVVTLGIVVLVLGVLLAERLMPGDRTRVCLTPHCMRVAARLKQNLNTTADPCENFYDFACGGYKQDGDIPVELPGLIASIGYWRKEKARQLLELPVRRDVEHSAERKLKDFYHSCIQDGFSEEARLAAARRLVHKLGGWSRPVQTLDFTDWSPDRWSFYDSLLIAYRDLQTSPFFRMFAEVEHTNGTMKAFLKIEGLDPFECGPTTDRSRTFARNLALAFNSRGDPSDFVSGVVSVYDKVCKGTTEWRDEMWTKIKIRDFARRFPRSASSIEDIVPLFEGPCSYKVISHKVFELPPRRIPWVRLLKDMWGLDEASVIKYNEADADRLQNLDDITGMNRRSLRDYMAIRFLVKYMAAMPKSLQDIFMDYSGGQWAKMERNWETCLEIHHNKIFSLALLAELDRVSKYPSTSDEKLREIERNIRRAVIERTGEVNWLPEEIKIEAQRTIANKLVLMAGPPWVIIERKLDRFYANLTISRNLTYLENIVNVNTFSGQISLERLTRHSGLDYFIYTWNIDAIFANPDSLHGTGAIGKRGEKSTPLRTLVRLHKDAFTRTTTPRTVFATMLQDPFYSHDSPGYLNYGGVGFVIGHEFGHDFEFRRLIKRRSDHKPLHNRLSCMMRAYMKADYRGYKAANESLDKMTGQMTADISGLKWAFQAYQKDVASVDPPEKLMPGLDYTREQLFFINAIQGMCAKPFVKFDSRKLDFRIARIQGLVTQVRQLGDAFQCSSDSSIRQFQDCDIW